MRRIFVFSILFQWIAFLIAAAADGLGLSVSGYGLLADAQRVLTSPDMLGLDLVTARMLITFIVICTLSVALWALMLSATDAGEVRQDRLMALGIAFSWTMLAASICLGGALLVGAYGVVRVLAAVQAATLLSAVAAGGVEFAMESPVSAKARPEARHEDLPRPAQMAVESARIARLVHANGN